MGYSVVIVDINETVRAIRYVIQDVETQMSVKIREVYVGILDTMLLRFLQTGLWVFVTVRHGARH